MKTLITLIFSLALAASSQAAMVVNSFVVGGVVVPQAEAPTFSPVAGSYTGTQVITLTSGTPSSSFYYTTDGSTPTTSSTLYTGPVSLTSTTTLKAITHASGYSDSTVTIGTYTITPASWETIENFEGSNSASQGPAGYDLTGWTASSASVTPHYNTSPAPIAGSYSFFAGLGGRYIQRAFVTKGTYANVFYKRIDPGTWTTSSNMIYIADSAGVVLAKLTHAASSTKLTVTCGTVTATSSAVFSSDTVYDFWLEYTAATGAGGNGQAKAYAVAAGGTKTLVCSVTTGDSAVGAVADHAQIYSGNAGIVDRVIMDGANPITSNP